MVIEMTLERRLRRLWLTSMIMFAVSLAIFSTASRLSDRETIFVLVHGLGWGALALNTRARLDQLRLAREMPPDRRT